MYGTHESRKKTTSFSSYSIVTERPQYAGLLLTELSHVQKNGVETAKDETYKCFVGTH
jgi:hypothetical protein